MAAGDAGDDSWDQWYQQLQQMYTPTAAPGPTFAPPSAQPQTTMIDPVTGVHLAPPSPVAPNIVSGPTVNPGGAGPTADQQAGHGQPPTSTAGGGGSFQDFWQSFPGYSPAALKQAADQWNASHPNDRVTLGGSKGDKVTYQGKTYDAIVSAGLGGTGKAWNYLDPNAPSGGGNGFAIDPSYLQPFTEQFGAPSDAALPAVPNLPQFGGFDPFTGPNPQDIASNPAYQFRVSQGEQAIQNTNAARGLLNSGGALKDLLDYGQNAASQEWQNEWGRDFNVWNQTNQNKLTDFGAKLNTAVTGFGMGQQRADDSFNRAWNDYLTRRDTFFANQQNPFSKLYSVASLGVNSAAQ